MTQPAKSHEPSMEEILASIRRIIADDEPAKAPHESPYETPYGSRNESSPPASEPVAAQPPRPAAPPPAMAPPPMAPRVTPGPAMAIKEEIDAMLAQLQAASGQAPAVEGPAAAALDSSERVAAPAPVFDRSPPASVARAVEERRPALEDGERGLVSAATAAAVDSAFDALTRSVHVRNGRTLEELVSEMLRPMLKTWLDDNLPGIVERLVRAEIERLSRARD